MLVSLSPRATRAWPSLEDVLGGLAMAASALTCAILLGLLAA
jgi:hypothetical protein